MTSGGTWARTDYGTATLPPESFLCDNNYMLQLAHKQVCISASTEDISGVDGLLKRRGHTWTSTSLCDPISMRPECFHTCTQSCPLVIGSGILMPVGKPCVSQNQLIRRINWITLFMVNNWPLKFTMTTLIRVYAIYRVTL